jgi:hypothetical protein
MRAQACLANETSTLTVLWEIIYGFSLWQWKNMVLFSRGPGRICPGRLLGLMMVLTLAATFAGWLLYRGDPMKNTLRFIAGALAAPFGCCLFSVHF